MDEMASLMMPWGWPRNVGRMYAYLLLSDKPVTLDTISEDLRIAKSNASVAARTLEQFGNARRHSEPGSKRIYYSAPDILSGPFAFTSQLLGRISGLLASHKALARTDAVDARLDDMAGFYAEIRDAIQGVLDRYAGIASAVEGVPDGEEPSPSLPSSSATRAR